MIVLKIYWYSLVIAFVIGIICGQVMAVDGFTTIGDYFLSLA